MNRGVGQALTHLLMMSTWDEQVGHSLTHLLMMSTWMSMW
jgi:hypothetical protein